MSQIICPCCSSEMVRDTRPYDVVYRGVSKGVMAPGYWCASCHEVLFTDDDNKITDQALHELKAEKAGVMTPAQITAARESMGLNKQDANELLGLAERAFSKYEAGSVLPSKSTSQLIDILANVPEALAYLKSELAEHEPEEIKYA